jgi:hypothetical protein
MATATVSKTAVNKAMEGAWQVIFTLTYSNTTSVYFERQYPVMHKAGAFLTITCDKILTKMQKDITDYKAEQQLFNSSAMTSALTYIQNNIVP